MRVFVTGASGFIGSAVVPELIAAGHHVTGLARSETAAAAISGAGAQVSRGGLGDLDVLRAGARAADAVIHLGFIHDFTRFEESVRVDVAAIEALGAGLEGTDKPLIVASGVLGLKPGHVVTELDEAGPGFRSPRQASVRATLALAARAVRPALVRLAPTVHDAGDHGFVPTLIEIARQRKVSAYVGDGAQRWPAVHRRDAARLFRLAAEQAPNGVALHGTAEEGVPVKAIAEVIGRKLDLPVASIAPEAAAAHFGWIGAFIAFDSPASNTRTRELLGWNPTHPGLIEDMEAHYFR